ncbi:LecA/PA-IL family lectin [Enterobacter mori]
MATAALWTGKIPASSEEGVRTGIVLKKGEKITILAKGWARYSEAPHAWTAPQGVLPEGPGKKYEHNVVLNARLGSGTNLHPIGNGVYEWPAPEDGELILLVADSTYTDNSGEFEATVYKSQENSVQEEQVWSGSVPADKPEGASTGLQVKAGDKITITASGWIKYGKEEFALATPYGRVREGLVTRDEVVLKARINGTSYDIGGGVHRWEIPVNGELSLYVVDRAGGYIDNSGSFKVDVYK